MNRIMIELRFGNDAMKYPRDVPDALRELARRFEVGQTPQKVMDRNGNSVGRVHYGQED